MGRFAYPGVSDTVALAAAAGATTRIGLLSAVLLAPTWPGALLAKELAGIDGMSGGRLTVGLGVGTRPDDFVADGYGTACRGRSAGPRPGDVPRDLAGQAGRRRFESCRAARRPGDSAAVRRMVRGGDGSHGALGRGLHRRFAARPAAAPNFERAKQAWQRAGRTGSPRLVALAYYALGDPEASKRNVYAYYSTMGGEGATSFANAVCGSPEAVRATIAAHTDLGVDELMLNTGTDDLDDIARLADIVF